MFFKMYKDSNQDKEGKWLEILSLVFYQKCHQNLVSSSIKQEKISVNSVRKINLIQRENKIIFSYSIDRWFFLV